MVSEARSDAALACFDKATGNVRAEQLGVDDHEERAKISARLRRRAPLKVSQSADPNA
jgi:hypothetical protein